MDHLINVLLIDEQKRKEAMDNSFHNFHAKGLDYICLFRSEEYTVKIYILDGDASKLPEVVNPHDHRYTFRTTVLSGSMIDHHLVRGGSKGLVYNAFDYLTPLNGGNGFTFRGEERITKIGSLILFPGDKLESAGNKIHTIQMQSDQTIIKLEQFADHIPLDIPTSTWFSTDTKTVSLDGLYDKFTEESFIQRLHTIKGASHV